LKTTILLIAGLILGSTYVAYGQATVVTSDSAALAKRKDLIDVWHSATHTQAKNRDEGKFHNAPFPAVGYTQATGFAAVLSDNLAFYTGDPLTSKVSDISTSITYSQYNQIILPVLADIWTKNDKWNIVADWRYMKYPSTTFGLGGHTDYSDGYTIDFSYIKLHTSLLRKITPDFYAGLGFYYDYFWNIREVDPPPGTITSFEKYGLSATEAAAGPTFRFLYDNRINPINPFQGFYANIVFHPVFKMLGGNTSWMMYQIDLRKYFSLRSDGRNILALWSFNWLTSGGKTPYLLLPSTGWDDNFNTGRGYIQGRFRGNDMGYLEAEDRITLSRNGLFGMVVFVNAETFSKNLASRYDNIAPGFGTGIRIKLNKHSGANICVDYGIGLQGSQGFSVNLGEVF
jgi:outer membrane protein assembly factor BamA